MRQRLRGPTFSPSHIRAATLVNARESATLAAAAGLFLLACLCDLPVQPRRGHVDQGVASDKMLVLSIRQSSWSEEKQAAKKAGLQRITL